MKRKRDRKRPSRRVETAIKMIALYTSFIAKERDISEIKALIRLRSKWQKVVKAS